MTPADLCPSDLTPGPTPTATPAPTTGRTGLFQRVQTWIRHLLTGRDNQTLDLGRVSWAGSFLACLGHEAWALTHGSGSSLRDFAVALAAVSAAHGVALGLKAKTEPGDDA